LVDLANKGDADAKVLLREVLDNNPVVWRKVGDLAALSRLTQIRLIADGNQLLFESVQRAAHEMEAELLGADPTRLDRMLVERVVACWLQLQHVEAVAFAAANGNLVSARHWAQEQDRAHRRHLSAVKALTTTRQLLAASGANRKPESPAGRDGKQTPDACDVEQNRQHRADVASDEKSRAIEPPNHEPTNGHAFPSSTNGHPINRILPFAETASAK
jgi:hypothetical protein